MLAAAVAAFFYRRWKAALVIRAPYTPLSLSVAWDNHCHHNRPRAVVEDQPQPVFPPLGTAGLSHQHLRNGAMQRGARFPERVPSQVCTYIY